jgi:hypothetical protein
MTAIAIFQLQGLGEQTARDVPMTVYMAAEIFPTWPLASSFLQ